MRRGRIFFYLAFIIILGLVAVVVVWQRFLQPAAQPQANVTAPAPVEMVDIVMVTQKVPRGGVLDRQVLELVPWQKSSLIDGMFTNLDEVVGRQARYELTPGVPLMSSMLVDSADQISGGGIAALSIPRGMVAVSIPISRLSSVSYAPQSGDHVNVIVTTMFVDLDTDFQTVLPNQTLGVIAPGTGTLTGSTGQSQNQGETQAQGSAGLSVESNSIVALSGGGGATQGRAEVDPVLGQTFYLVPSERQRPRITSQNLIQDVIVLKMGDFTYEGQQQPQVSGTPQATTEEQTTEATAPTAPKPPDVVTLIVTPQDAVSLNYLIYSGAELTLALRAANDDSRFETEAVTLQFLLDQYNIPVPVKLPYGVEPRKDSLSLPVLKNDIVPTPAP